MTKHFGYGSNLWIEQMDTRCTDNKNRVKGKLKDYRWIITEERGYANIVESKGDYVLGFVYEISATDEKELDKNEGATERQGFKYTKEKLEIEVSGDKYECLVYIDRKNIVGGVGALQTIPKSCSVGCECTYTDRINRGVEDFSNDEDKYITSADLRVYVEKYIRKFISAN